VRQSPRLNETLSRIIEASTAAPGGHAPPRSLL
jgi:patatin-like phospholipase/acyl hydrolase